MELKLSPRVEQYLLLIAKQRDTLFSTENLAVDLPKKAVKIPKRISKQTIENLSKIKAQLPMGIYTNPISIKEFIQDSLKSTVVDVMKYSPLVLDYPEFHCCKQMKYRNGNIITGRDKEIDDILLAFTKSSKRGVILVGEPGVGKTAIVRAINNRLIERTVPRQLNGCYILNLDIPYVLAKHKDDPIGTITKVLEKASETDKVILFIDEVHQLLGHRMNDMMKPYLTEKIRFIGSTTIDEYHSIITEDRALERRFTIVPIDEPNLERTTKMVIGTKSVFETYHKCIISDAVCEYTVINGSRFLGNRKNPDKSLDLLDIACSIMYEKEIKINYPKVEETEFSLESIEAKHKALIECKEYAGNRILNEDYVNIAISSVTGIPFGDIKNSLDYNQVVDNIKLKAFGQDEQIKTISNVVNIFKHTKADRTQPVSVLLVIGSSGVGKTLVCSELAKNLYGKDHLFIDYDMTGLTSEFMITELKGAPPGYVGYSKSGRLIKQIRNNPQSVVYFRGINKAHETIQQYIIDACRNGKMIDSAEREAPLNNAVIVYSVTLTDEDYTSIYKNKKKAMGFSKTEETENIINEKTLKSLVGEELINAADEVVVFDSLSSDTLSKIFDTSVDEYLEMYNVDVDKAKLKEVVLKDAKNGGDVVSKLRSEVPKVVFKTLKQKES